MAKKKTTEEFKKDLCQIFEIDEKAFELLSPYREYDQKILFKCNICGLKKEVIASSLLKKSNKKKHICRCYGYPEEWHQQLREFRKWESAQEEYAILSEFKGLRKNLRVKCKSCNSEQNRSVGSLMRGDECLVCKSKHGILKTEEQLSKELFEKYGGEYEYIKGYKGVTAPALFRHTVCGKIYSTQPHYLLSFKGGTCPICRKGSKGERAISLFLKNNNIIFEEQKRFSDFRRYPYDFFIPQKNLLIEFQGIQHFQPVQRFGGESSFLHQKEIDFLKKKYALERGFNFLEISYLDLANINFILVQRLSCGGSSESETAAISEEMKIQSNLI